MLSMYCASFAPVSRSGWPRILGRIGKRATAGRRTTRRGLIVGLGSTGYVALYEILPGREVRVLAIRHQREEDYH